MNIRELVVGGVLLLLGGVLVWTWTLEPALQVLAARGWTETTCTVVASEAVEQSDGGYAVPVSYTYTVAGAAYTGSNAAVVPRSYTRPEARSQVAVWEPGSTWPCFVDPADPSRATLDRAGSWSLSGGWLGLLLMVPILGAFFKTPEPGRVVVDSTRVIAGQLGVSAILAALATVLFGLSIVVGGEWGLAAAFVLGLTGVLLAGLWALVAVGVVRLFRTRIQLEIDALVEGQPVAVRWTSSRPLQTLQVQLVGVEVRAEGDAELRNEVYRSVILTARPDRSSGTGPAQIEGGSSVATEWFVEVQGTDDRGAPVHAKVQVGAPRPKG